MLSTDTTNRNCRATAVTSVHFRTKNIIIDIVGTLHVFDIRTFFLRGFWARGRVRGDRSVFVTSHRPVHSSRAFMFSAWFELLHFRTGAIFLV